MATARSRFFWASLLVSFALGHVADAAIIVNPPLPIQHRVTVQLIRTAHDDGDPVATAFGDDAQRADIERSVDEIWAQAGVDIDFIDSINVFHSTHAYNGESDLASVLNNAQAAGALAEDRRTINLVFVNHVPGFDSHSVNSAAGRAYVDGNGIAEFVGDNLLGFANGRDVIAEVTAHEIGHNLGLNHTATGGDNLMSPSGSSSRLTASQIAEVLQSSFVRPFAAAAAGDLNLDGVADAADYTVWRDGLGAQYTGDHYDAWRSAYGAAPTTEAVSVPEPAACAFVALVWAARRRRR